HAGGRLAPNAFEQAFEGFEERQIGLGPCEAFRAASARHSTGLATRCQLAEKVLDQSGLADAGLAGHAQEQPLTTCRRLEGATQFREFFLATHRMTFDGRNRRTCRPTRLQLCSRLDRENTPQVCGEIPGRGVTILMTLGQRLKARAFQFGRYVADELP